MKLYGIRFGKDAKILFKGKADREDLLKLLNKSCSDVEVTIFESKEVKNHEHYTTGIAPNR